ncbi:MAG: glycosyltransferase family 39 protein [Caldilineaceae bacterium]
MNRSYRRPLLLGLVLAAFALRTFGLDRQSLWRDEVDAIYFAVRNLDETLSMFVQAAQNGPLYFLGLRPWFALMGTWEYVLRFPSAVAGTLSVPLLWQVGRMLLPERADSTVVQGGVPVEGVDAPRATPGAFVATLAAVLMTFNPYQVWYGQEGKMYATITCLMLLATYFWLRGITRGRVWPWLGYWLTVTVAMYTHLLMVLVIPVHMVWFLVAWPASRRHWRGYVVALAGLILPYLPMVWWHWWLLTSPEKLSGFSFTPLNQVLEGLLLNHARGFIGTIQPLWLAPIFFLGGAGLLLGAGRLAAEGTGGLLLAPWRRIGLLVTWLVLPIAFIYLISLRQPVFTERYVIWIGPAALLAVALGLRVLHANSGRIAPAVTAVLLVYILGVWGYANWQQKTLTIKYDLRGAVQYVQAHRNPDELLILQIPHQEWSFRYYSDSFSSNPFVDSDARLGRWMQGPYTNYGQPDAEARAVLDAQMQAGTSGQPTVWVMVSEATMWDSRQLMNEWLNQHGTMVEKADFPGVSVLRYQMKEQ